MAAGLVRVERVGPVARAILNDPERRNAMSYSMISELVAAFRDLDADPEVRAVVLTGAGEHFSAGADLREFAAELKQNAARHWESGALWEQLFSFVPAMAKPVVAAVQGYALGGGCGLVALCDLAVASDDAKLGMTEINVGLFPLLVLPALQRAVGERWARELALTGAIIDAAEAHRIGLVNRLVSRAQVPAAALELAAALASRSPEAIRLGKHVLATTQDMTYAQAIAFARSARVTFLLSEGLREGVEAFVSKRTPKW
jgi:enoyl-CoA hydratase/carnithine racemase